MVGTHNIYIIEDACEAIGTPLEGYISCLSFQSTKTMTTGEGGMCLTNDKAIADKVRFLKDHAMTAERKYYHTEVGFNYRMCLPSGTKVSTAKKINWANKLSKGESTRIWVKSIEDIEVGDVVLSFNEKTGKKETKKVIGTSISKSNNLIKLVFSNGNELILTSNHPLYIHNKGWVESKDVSIGDKAIQYKYHALHWRLFSLHKRGKSLKETYGYNKALEISKNQSARMKLLRADPNSSYNTSTIFNSREMHIKHGDSLRRTNKERDLYPPERRAKTGKFFKSMWNDPNSIFNNPETCKKRYGAISIGIKRRLASDPEFASIRKEACRKLAQYRNKKPTSLESNLIDLLNEHIPNVYKYVGDGKFWIENANPDFINVNGYKKAIEIYSAYWKVKDYGSVEEYHNQRGDLFNKYGWDVLFLEAKRKIINPDLIVKKILDFTYNPNTEIVSIVGKEVIREECTVYNLDVDQNNNFYAFGILVHNSNLQAAVGVAQLERLDELIDKKLQINHWYHNELSCMDGITQQYGIKNTCWVTAILVESGFGISRDELMARLKEAGIETRIMFYPIHLMPPYKQKHDCPVATELSQKGMYLPSGVNLKKSQVEYICNVIKRCKC
jgi:intein/homing endonuclease